MTNLPYTITTIEPTEGEYSAVWEHEEDGLCAFTFKYLDGELHIYTKTFEKAHMTVSEMSDQEGDRMKNVFFITIKENE